MSETIAVVGALDIKSKDFYFVKKEIERRGYHALVIDIGVVGAPEFQPEINSQVVADAGGEACATTRRPTIKTKSVTNTAPAARPIYQGCL